MHTLRERRFNFEARNSSAVNFEDTEVAASNMSQMRALRSGCRLASHLAGACWGSCRRPDISKQNCMLLPTSRLQRRSRASTALQWETEIVIVAAAALVETSVPGRAR